jgi:hypothetical protein
MRITIPSSLLKPALFASLAAYLLCLVTATLPFIGFAELFAVTAMLLFGLVFPLFLGAVLLLVGRSQGQMTMNWMPILFTGLPSWFSKVYRVYFLLVWLGGAAAFVQAFRHQPGWIGLFFVLVPSVFFATCVGAYWSELRERQKGEPGSAAKGSQPMGAETNGTSSAAGSRR